MRYFQRLVKCPVCGSSKDLKHKGAKFCAGCFGKPCSGQLPEQKARRCHCGGTLKATGEASEFRCDTCRIVYELTPDTALCDDRPERNAEKKEEFALRKREMIRKQAVRF